jgi:transcriptional regulator with XRE-family HTH domain
MKRGRPSRYHDFYLPIIAELAAGKGFTDKELAKKLGVTERTINNWKEKYPDFFQSLKKGKNETDDKVENALLGNALGYEYEEKEYIVIEGVEKLKTRKIKHMKPDTTAQIFWLKNRRKKRWRDTQEIEIHDKTEYEKELEKLTDEELIEKQRKIEEELKK